MNHSRVRQMFTQAYLENVEKFTQISDVPGDKFTGWTRQTRMQHSLCNYK